MNSWSMEWTAPETGLGPVTFYTAVNASVDKVYTIYTSSKITGEQVASVGNELLANKVSVYPNPATDYVNVAIPAGSEIKLYDMVGRQLISIPQTSHKERLNISSFDQGMYFLQVEHEGNTATQRFLKN